MTFHDLVPTLQFAIGPVILVSGIGLLLLSMTNRFGRVIDRSRASAGELQGASSEDRSRIMAQLRVLVRRARIVRAAIAFASVSVLLAGLLIISLFVSALLDLDLSVAIVLLFSGCLLCLIASLILFISDINLSLNALWLELPEESMRASDDA